MEAHGYHVEICDPVHEVTARPPRQGTIILRDTYGSGDVAAMLARLVNCGIWLPAIVAGHNPSPSQVVEPTKAGALYHIELPLVPEKVERCLARIADEASRVRVAR